MQAAFLSLTIGFMKILILWSLTILGLSSLFFRTPFLGAFFLLIVLIIAIVVSHQQKQATLPPIIWLTPKLILAGIFLTSIGHSLYLYLDSIQCLSCLHGILASNLPVPFSYSRESFLSFCKGLWAFNNRVSFFFLLIIGFIILQRIIHTLKKHQKKGSSHV